MAKEIKNYYQSFEIRQVSCEAIRPNRAQPRSDFDSASLEKLAESIKRYGVIQPLAIKRSQVGDYYDYELISGERRQLSYHYDITPPPIDGIFERDTERALREFQAFRA